MEKLFNYLLTKFSALILCLLFLFTVGCQIPKNEDEENLNQKNDLKVYLDITRDAPMDFYCEVNELLNSKTRMNICNILSDSVKTLSSDMLVTIKDNKIDTIEMIVFSFNEETGKRQISDENYTDLNIILNSVDISSVQTMNRLKNGDYVWRLQLERFCSGYVEFVTLKKEE